MAAMGAPLNPQVKSPSGWLRCLGQLGVPEVDGPRPPAGDGLYDHEGYLGLVLEDGRVTGGWSLETERRSLAYRAACECGWQGQVTHRPGRLPEEDERDAMMEEWDDHVAPHLAALERVGPLQHVTQGLRDATRAATAAMARGATNR